MSVVLGVSCHSHDAAAALVIDGSIRGAVQEERLSRVKSDPSVPSRAIAHLLSEAGLAAGDIDRVVYYEDPYAKIERVLSYGLARLPRSMRSLPRALSSQLGRKLWVLDEIASVAGVPRSKVHFASHHRSHAASALYTSPFQEAAVLVVDGVGERASTTLWDGPMTGLSEVASVDFPHSLGLLYAAITAWLGFAVNDGEYKVMGLAAFGRPTMREEIDSMLLLSPDGGYRLDLEPFAAFTDPDRAYGPSLVERLGAPRPPSLPWDLASPRDRRYADVAASLQQALEEALLALCRRLKALTGKGELCLAGGVALNAVANTRIARESGFSSVYVHPAAGDAGGALGAALLGALDLGERLDRRFTPLLGPRADPDRAWSVARALGLTVIRREDPAAALVERLSAGQVVAVCDGRCEWGPRALGSRSLLARADRLESRERINAIIKRREPFRPFAPAVRDTDCAQHFEGLPDAMTPYMTSVRPVRSPQSWPAVTHVDGSARLQTLASGGLLYEALGQIPVLLNTSLNAGGEPICGSATDAISFLLKHPADALLVGDLEITRGRS